MTIKQLPDFAFRSATDYAPAMDQTPRPLRPGPRRRGRRRHGAAVAVRRSSARRGSASAWSCSSPRSSSARSTGRRGCGAASATSGSSSPSRTSTRACPTGPRWTAWPPDDVRARPAPDRLPRPRGDRRRRDALPVRRPPPVHEDGDAAHPPRADPVPRRGRGDLPARRRAGPRRRRGRVADRPADRDARAPARPEPRLRGARLRHRPADRLHDRPRGLPGRPGDRAQDDPGQRPAVGRAATRSTRTGSGRRRTCILQDGRRRDPVGRPGADDRRRVRPAVRLGRRSPAATWACSSCSTRRPTGPASSSPSRTGSSGPRPTARRSRTCYAAVDLHRGDTKVSQDLDLSIGLTRLQRVHAAHRQARPGPGARLDRLRAASSPGSPSRSTGRAAASGRGSRPDGRLGDRLALGPLRRRRARVRAAARPARGGPPTG